MKLIIFDQFLAPKRFFFFKQKTLFMETEKKKPLKSLSCLLIFMFTTSVFCVYYGICVLWCGRGLFSPSTFTWVLGVQLRSSGFAQVLLLSEASPCPFASITKKSLCIKEKFPNTQRIYVNTCFVPGSNLLLVMSNVPQNQKLKKTHQFQNLSFFPPD